MQLYEQYRPKSFDEFLGQDKITSRIQRMMERPQWDRDAIWLEGGSGCGKTSLAWIIARQIADEFDIEELDGERCDISAVRELERSFAFASASGWRVAIINESHGITSKAVQGFLTMLERLRKNRLVLFTSTERLTDNLFGNFSAAFQRRCKVYSFSSQGLAPLFAQRLREIALAEGLDGQSEHRYLRLIQDCKNNMGLALQRVEQGEMLGD